jgi:hypothetical protein
MHRFFFFRPIWIAAVVIACFHVSVVCAQEADAANKPSKELPPAFNLVWEQIQTIQIIPGDNSIGLSIRLDEKTGTALAAFTEANLQKRIRFQLNGHTTMQPGVQEKITGGVIQLQVQTLEEANQVLAYFYKAHRPSVASPALDAMAAEIHTQQQRLAQLMQQKQTLRNSGASPLDQNFQELDREINQLSALISEITNRYQRERAILKQ